MEHEDQCPKKRERFPTSEVRYEEHELEELLALERPKKTKKDISQLQYYNCKEMGHYASECPEKKKSQEDKQKLVKPKMRKDISQVICKHCKELGHYASYCLEKPPQDLNLITCFKCKELGHYANRCPGKLHQDPKQAKM